MPSNAKIGFSELLHQALYSDKGFYERQVIEEHFITPSIGGACYARLLAEYAAFNELEHMVEYGAGTGQLAQHLAPFSKKYQIVEKSSYCQCQQREQLVNSRNISWVAEPCFKEKNLILIQEVFDCLETPLCSVESGVFLELVYDRFQDTLCLESVSPGTSLERSIKHYAAFLDEYVSPNLWQHGQLFMLPAAAFSWLLHLYQKVSEGSHILIIDYGEAQPALAQKWSATHLPLRGYQNHHLVTLNFSLLGECDLTYDVDFYYLAACWVELGGRVLNYQPLGCWLAARVCSDEPSLKMLIEPRFMGQRFKVLELLR